MKKFKWLLVPLSVFIVLTFVLSGCTGSTSTTTQISTATVTNSVTTTTTDKVTTTATKTQTVTTTTEKVKLVGEITEAGSTTVQPVLESIAAAFKASYPDVSVVVQGGGSSVGVKSAAEGTVDIGAASRELKTSEQTLGLEEHVLAKDAIAIVAHPSQTVSDLTKEQVKAIFSGEITNWSEVGGADKSIHVVSREEGSGTRAAFEEMVMGDALIVATAILQPSNGAVRTTVSGDPDAIAFLSLGYVDTSVKALSIDGVAANLDNALNGTYPIVRPLLLLTKGEPTGLVKEFIDFCLSSEGQAIVAEDYIPVK